MTIFDDKFKKYVIKKFLTNLTAGNRVWYYWHCGAEIWNAGSAFFAHHSMIDEEML
jgi:hypothetical protein